MFDWTDVDSNSSHNLSGIFVSFLCFFVVFGVDRSERSFVIEHFLKSFWHKCPAVDGHFLVGQLCLSQKTFCTNQCLFNKQVMPTQPGSRRSKYVSGHKVESCYVTKKSFCKGSISHGCQCFLCLQRWPCFRNRSVWSVVLSINEGEWSEKNLKSPNSLQTWQIYTVWFV